MTFRSTKRNQEKLSNPKFGKKSEDRNKRMKKSKRVRALSPFLRKTDLQKKFEVLNSDWENVEAEFSILQQQEKVLEREKMLMKESDVGTECIGKNPIKARAKREVFKSIKETKEKIKEGERLRYQQNKEAYLKRLAEKVG